MKTIFGTSRTPQILGISWLNSLNFMCYFTDTINAINTVDELRSAFMCDSKCSTTFPWCTINAPAAFPWCTINAPAVFAWCTNQSVHKVQFSYIEWNGVHTLWLGKVGTCDRDGHLKWERHHRQKVHFWTTLYHVISLANNVVNPLIFYMSLLHDKSSW